MTRHLRPVPPPLRVIDCADLSAIEAVLASQRAAVEFADACLTGASTPERDVLLDAYATTKRAIDKAKAATR
jgi:hypothetical protein